MGSVILNFLTKNMTASIVDVILYKNRRTVSKQINYLQSYVPSLRILHIKAKTFECLCHKQVIVAAQRVQIRGYPHVVYCFWL